jgi:hypothetical protein
MVQKKRKKTDPLLQSLRAMVHLYGVIPCEEAIGIYNRLFPAKIPATLEDLDRIDFDQEYFDIEEGCIAHECLFIYEDENVRKLLVRQAGKPRYIPGPDELLRYADEYYAEKNEAYLRLLDFIEHDLHVTHQTAEGLMEDLHLGVANTDYEVKHVLGEFDRRDIEFDDPAIVARLMPLIQAFIDNTRCWANNGHTPLEIRALVPASSKAPLVVMKAGRNDPCPCGSGRKFKNCCGSNRVIH